MVDGGETFVRDNKILNSVESLVVCGRPEEILLRFLTGERVQDSSVFGKVREEIRDVSYKTKEGVYIGHGGRGGPGDDLLDLQSIWSDTLLGDPVAQEC